MAANHALLLAAACVAISGPLAPAAAADDATFRSGTHVVAVPSTVTDGDQRIIANLTQDDFEVLDNEQPRTITFFANEPQPVRVVVLLDTSASMIGTMPLLRTAARTFVDRLRDGDLCRVGAFNDDVRFGGPFTADHAALADDIANLAWGNTTRLYDALATGIDTLAGDDGRRVILVLTDGADTESDTNLRTVVQRARAGGVMVYAVGLARARRASATPSVPDRGLKTLAQETGGGYVALTGDSDLADAFGRIADELHSQYVIGFSPERLDGRIHSLAVRVKRPGLTARSRRSYVAVRDATTGAPR